jgi:hypothetical protein
VKSKIQNSMKRCYFTVFACFLLSIVFAQTNNQAVINNGNWVNNSTWGLGHAPQNDEVGIVQAGDTVIVNSNIQVTTDITLKVYGNLHFDVGKLRLTANSFVLLYPGATITSSQGTSSDKIEIGGISKYSGSDGTLSGPLMANSGTTGFTLMPIFLPVKFVAYNVSALSDGQTLVKWSTSEENNVSHYIVERSTDGYNWQAIGQLPLAQQYSVFNNYSYVDKETITGIAFYRVKQVDIDGHFMYTSIKSIRSNSRAPEIKISSVAGNVIIEFSKEIKGTVTAQLISFSGQVIAQQISYQPSGYIFLKNESGLKGNYIVRVNDGQDLNFTKQIFIN